MGALVLALLVVLAATGPRPETEASGPIRRLGGVCLQLEMWSLLSWEKVGQSYTVSDIANGIWHESVENPPCAAVPKQIYLVRPPFDAPEGVYRLCGLNDSQPCLEFTRVPFEGSPGP